MSDTRSTVNEFLRRLGAMERSSLKTSIGMYLAPPSFPGRVVGPGAQTFRSISARCGRTSIWSGAG
jgi:hypothetical protein